MPYVYMSFKSAHLCPVVLVSVIKCKPDETYRGELYGATPEFAAHFCVPSKAPVCAFAMCCDDCGVVHHLKTDHVMRLNATFMWGSSSTNHLAAACEVIGISCQMTC